MATHRSRGARQPETAHIQVGRQYKTWIEDYIALEAGQAMTVRQFVERLVKNFRGESSQRQQEILRGSPRPFNQIGGPPVEVLPPTASVFRA